MSLVDYLEPDQVASLILDPSSVPGRDYLIVDVRGEDAAFGNIPGAYNIPSHEFLENIEFHKTKILAKIPRLVFHCALSQVRGPKCAQRYATIKETFQKIFVLRGGFSAFGALYHSDPRLVLNYNQEYWDDPY